MKLSRDDKQQLYTALLDAYRTLTALKRMFEFQLKEKEGEHLSVIAGEGKLEDVVFELIDWAEREGKLERLISGAYEENQGNTNLKEFYQRYFHFPNPASVLSLEQWQEIQLILSEIDYDLLEQTCRETLKGKTKNIEDNFPRIIYFKNLLTLKEILLEQCPEKNHIPTVLEFAERLNNNKQIPETYRKKIKEWLEKVAKEKNIKLPTYQETQLFSITANSYLMLVIEKETKVSDNFKLQAELIYNYQESDRKPKSVPIDLNEDGIIICSFDDLEDNLAKFVAKAYLNLLNEGYTNHNLTIELFLPINYLVKYFDVKIFTNECKPIRYYYQLVGRCLDRYVINIDNILKQFRNNLEKKWSTFQDFLRRIPANSDLQDKIVYLDFLEENYNWDEFSTEWARSLKLAVNVTGCIPQDESQEQLFDSLMRAGIPICLWHTCQQFDCVDIEQKFNQIIALDCLQDLGQLFRKIHYLRQDAYNQHERAAEKLGYHLGFLCDHPYRIPSVLEKQNQILLGTN